MGEYLFTVYFVAPQPVHTYPSGTCVFDSDLTLHSLRYSCVSMLVHSGADIKDIQTWVGHSDIKTTLDIYAQTNKFEKNKTANMMASFLTSPEPTKKHFFSSCSLSDS